MGSLTWADICVKAELWAQNAENTHNKKAPEGSLFNMQRNAITAGNRPEIYLALR